MSGPAVGDRGSNDPLYPPSPFEIFIGRVFDVLVSIALFVVMVGMTSVALWCWLSLFGIVK